VKKPSALEQLRARAEGYDSEAAQRRIAEAVQRLEGTLSVPSWWKVEANRFNQLEVGPAHPPEYLV